MNKTIIFSSVLLILGFALASFYCFPSNDDFVYSGFVATKGILGTQISHYLEWGGRFSSNLIISIIGHIDPVWTYYSYWALGLVLLSVFSFWVMVKSFVSKNAFTLSLIILALFLSRAPSITQFYYWLTGAIYYSVGIFASALGIGFLYLREKKPHFLITPSLFVLTLIIVGNNEISLIGWQELLLTVLVLKKLKTGKWDFVLVTLLIVGTIAGLFSLFAPGNFIRQSHFEKSGQVFRTVSNGVLHYFIFSVRLLSVPLVILCIKFRKEIVDFAQNFLNGINEEHAKKIIWLHWFLFLFTTSALAFWAMGRKPNTRSLNVVTFFYWISIPAIMWLLSKSWKKPFPNFLIKPFSFVDKHWVYLTSLTLFLSFNGHNLVNDYLFKFSDYRTEWVRNLEALHNGKDKDVTLYPIKTRAETTHFSDLLSGGTNNLQTLFGIKSIQVKDQ